MKINIKIIVMLILSVSFIIFIDNDYFLYKTPIMKVTTVNNKIESEEYSGEKHYEQLISGKIMNGKYKNKILTVTNRYSTSLIYGDKIEKNTKLLVKVSNNGTRGTIEGIKRDKYIAILFILFIDLILLIAGTKGLKTLLSLLINILITILAIFIYKNKYMNINLLFLYSIISILFIILSLLITNKKDKKTLSAILSSIISLFVSFLLSLLLVKLFGKNINIWTMNYIEVVYDYYSFFYICILLGGLGAIMDISISISSSLNELIEKNPNIEKKDLIKSGKIISKDIVGTMINVMLFTCYTSIIPIVLLAIRNSMPLKTALEYFGDLELTIVLCNCIGITLAIPISLSIAILILFKKKEGLSYE